MEEQREVPQIRFKGFTDDWEQRKLDEITDVRDGTHDSPKYLESGKAFITSKNVRDGNIIFDDFEYISEEDFNNINKRSKVDKNDILMGMIGTIGNIALIKEKPDFAIKNVALIKDISKINYLYNYYALQSQFVINQMNIGLDGGTQKFLSLNKIRELNIMVPLDSEQSKIGELFTNLDNLITLHQRKCDKLIEVKKSLLEKMFPKNSSKIPEIRFKGFTDDWEQRKLSDFGIATGGTSIESEFSSNGKYKVISIGSYSENSNYNDQGIRAIHSDKTKTRVLNKEDLTMILNDKTASGRIIGRVLYIDKSGEYVYNQRTERIEINRELYNPKFIYHLLNAPEMRNKIIKQSQGNTQIFVNWNGIKNTEYLIPHLNEQARLEKIFANIDNLITLHQRKLEKLKEVKKSMLEKMFV